MKLPISWLAEYVAFPKKIGTNEIVSKLVELGFEVEGVETFGDVSGKIIVGKIEKIETLTEFKKPIRYCQVNVGSKINGIICGAQNFVEGDLVVVALPGTRLPGDFVISERETYGKVSQGMICSAKEIGFGESHDGILVLPSGLKVGSDLSETLGLGETVLDIAVLPDRGYAMSVRGIARELASAFGVKFSDPANFKQINIKKSSNFVAGIKTEFASKISLIKMKNYNIGSKTPIFMQKRLNQCGYRSISLPVDITNYLMIELGQPLHAFDADKVIGNISIRNAKTGEEIESLDHIKRKLTIEDLVIADSKKALSVAGVMGGLESEISETTKNIIIESAIFDRATVSKTARSLKLPSEASKRFERGTDPQINEVSANKAAQLLAKYGNAETVAITSAKKSIKIKSIKFEIKEVSRLIGVDIDKKDIVKIFKDLGIKVTKNGNTWNVTPPSWRHDLIMPADLVEEIIRIHGYGKIPSVLPKSNIGQGLSHQQRIERSVSITLASLGLNEIMNYPFVSNDQMSKLQISKKDGRSNLVSLANPLSEETPFLRTTLIPGLFSAAARNIGRGLDDINIFEIGSVFQKKNKNQKVVSPKLLSRPSESDIAKLNSLLPSQDKKIAVILHGQKYKAGWWQNGNECLQICALNSQTRHPDGTCICNRGGSNQNCNSSFKCVNNSCKRMRGVTGEDAPFAVDLTTNIQW